MLRRLWPFFLPLLFLPNPGGGFNTQFGILELSDLLILPYLVLVWVAADLKTRTLIDRAAPLMLAFLGWALVTTVSINLRFEYSDYYNTEFGLLKLGKFILYGFTGYLTNKCLVDDRARRRLATAIVAAGVVLGIGAMLVGSKTGQQLAGASNGGVTGFRSSNAISVYSAMMACYLAGLWSQRRFMSSGTRKLTVLSLVALVLGSAITEGRGGYIAGIVGFAYILWRGGAKRQILALLIVVPTLVVAFYYTVPTFQLRVDRTLNPNTETEETTAGIDNGGRPGEWLEGLRQFRGSPVLGTGFFHRGANSGIYLTGSHNFFIQIFLETGVPGGVLMLLIFRRFWKDAGSQVAKRRGVELPVKACIAAAVIGGMGGEYFYGGIGLFTLFCLYATCGSMTPQITDRKPAATFAPDRTLTANT